MAFLHIRLKKVQGKKKRDAALAETKRKAETEEKGKPEVVLEPDEGGGDTDLLSSKDQDVIF